MSDSDSKETKELISENIEENTQEKIPHYDSNTFAYFIYSQELTNEEKKTFEKKRII
jgi:hypothetical protein